MTYFLPDDYFLFEDRISGHSGILTRVVSILICAEEKKANMHYLYYVHAQYTVHSGLCSQTVVNILYRIYRSHHIFCTLTRIFLRLHYECE